ncbi:AMP-binding protein [Thermogymnomonas acidicola]|nr:class I adenylate-forming enzyme family protein [Thermogymnomonas acidicola]
MDGPGQDEETWQQETFYSYFRNVADSRRSYPALIFRGKRITYQTLLRFSDSLCMNLTTRVPVTGERRLAVLTGNTPPSVMALLAASRSGTQVEFIDPTLPADIIRKRLDLTGASIVLVNEEDFHRVKDAERTTVVCRPQDFMSFEASVSYSIRTSLRSERRPRYGDAVIKLTDLIFDGSGGVPESLDVETPWLRLYGFDASGSQAVFEVSQGQCMALARAFARRFMNSDGRLNLVNTVPAFHEAAIVDGIIAPLSTGGSSALVMDTYDTVEAISACRDAGRPVLLAPGLLLDLIVREGLHASLRGVSVTVSVGHPGSHAMEALHSVPVTALIAASHPAAPGIFSAENATKDQAGDSYGTPLEGVSLEIVGDDGSVLPEGQEGYLNIRHQYGNVETGIRAFTRSGLLHIRRPPGDVLMNGGFYIDPVELEDLICRSGAVKECAALSTDEGIEVFAVPASDGWEGQLGNYSQRNIPYYMRPSRFRRVESIPRNMNGEVVRRLLVEEE